MQFIKPPTSYDQQIKILEDRGMLVPDHDLARHYLSHLNYYRISAYWLPFQDDSGNHQFKDSANFEDALDCYVFDRELRLLVMDAIERFEVSLRTQWAYHLAQEYGSHAYLDQGLFRNTRQYNISLDKLKSEIDRSHETFIKHYKATYTDPEYPPIWAVVEVMSYGQLSKLFSNLQHRKDRNSIARIYGLDEKIIVSLLHHLTIVRNTCAHHGRLWNRRFTFTIKVPNRGEEALLNSLSKSNTKYIYNTLVMLEYLIEIISPDSRWGERLTELLAKYKIANPKSMGFPDDWQKRAIWQKHFG